MHRAILQQHFIATQINLKWILSNTLKKNSPNPHFKKNSFLPSISKLYRQWRNVKNDLKKNYMAQQLALEAKESIAIFIESFPFFSLKN